MTDTVVPFSELLRARTRRSRDGAVGDGFLHDLRAGRCDVADYAALLAQYAFLYDALERAAARVAGDPVARCFVTEQLTRLPAIHTDLEFLVGPDWSELMSPLPATTRYIRRLNEVAATWPAGFVAHHYTRYLGDLADGRVTGRSLAEQFGFDTNGIGFLIVDQVADPSAFERTYRVQLDAAPWDAAEREHVIAEVELAHALDRAVLEELDGSRVPMLRAVTA